MAEYRYANVENNTDQGVVRNADGAFIPNDEKNRHWKAYQQWVIDGGITDNFPAEQQAKHEIREQLRPLYDESVNTDRQLLKLIAVMYQVGVSKGIWAKADFTAIDADIIDKIQTLRTKLTEIEDLETQLGG